MNRTKFIILLTLISGLAIGQELKGKYEFDGHVVLKVGTDNYVQKVSDCTYGFTTKGTYKISQDTLTLFPTTIIDDFDKKHRKSLITDTTNETVIQALRMTKYLVRKDSLIQLKQFSQDVTIMWTLYKK